eukprot:13100963-Alexandrium_andersonii.AAC.1
MARWLAPESTTHGTGGSLERSSSANPPSSPGFSTDSKRTHEGGPGLSMWGRPPGRGSNTR